MKPISFDLFLVVWNRQQGLETPRIHIRMARWLSARIHNDNERLLMMAFRSCGKSTLTGLLCAWILMLYPDTRILVLAAEHSLATKMVRMVKRIIEHHPFTQSLRPKRIDQWASDRFTVNRDMISRDPSVMAAGIRGNITGARADIIICDDVEVPNTCDSHEKRLFLRERLEELNFILSPNGCMLYIGTPHCYETIYAQKARVEMGEEKPYLHGFKRLEVPIINSMGESAWPEKFPMDSIEILRRRTGPNRFASQMLLQPVAISDGRLDVTLLNRYSDDIDYSEVQQKPILSIAGRKMVSASCWWDPAFGSHKGDGSVVAAIYTDEIGEYWLHAITYLETKARDETDEATQQCWQVARFLKTYHLPSITVEINGIGRFLPKILRRELAKMNIQASVLEISNSRPKHLRILEAFDAVLAAEMLHVHSSVYATPFIREMREWRPHKNTKDDGLDAVAGALSNQPIRIGAGLYHATNKPNWLLSQTLHHADTHFDI